MGRDKASMVIGADALNQGQRAVQELSPVCQKVFLSLRNGQTAPEGCEHLEIVRDNPNCPARWLASLPLSIKTPMPPG